MAFLGFRKHFVKPRATIGHDFEGNVGFTKAPLLLKSTFHRAKNTAQ